MWTTARCTWAPALLALLSAACGGHVDEHCSFGDGRARPAPPLAPVNPDFERMQAFRGYIQIAEVGAYRDHFVVYYDCIEPTMARVSAWREGDAIHIEHEGGYWGGLGVRPDDLEGMPEEHEDIARVIRRAVEEGAPDAHDIEITYVGTYREVRVHETVPDAPAGDIFTRPARTAEAVFAADEGLTTLERVRRVQTGSTMSCWESHDAVPCHGPARWVPVDASLQDGNLILPHLVESVSGRDAIDANDASSPELAALREAVLSAARDELADAPRPAFDPGPVAPLPAGLEQHVAAELRFHARTTPPSESPSESVTLRFDTSAAVFGGATAEGAVELEGRRYVVRARLSALSPPAADASGYEALTFALEVGVEDVAAAGAPDARAPTGVVQVRGPVLFDGGRAALHMLTADAATDDPGPPHRFDFSGFGRIESVDAHLDTRMFAQ